MSRYYINVLKNDNLLVLPATETDLNSVIVTAFGYALENPTVSRVSVCDAGLEILATIERKTDKELAITLK